MTTYNISKMIRERRQKLGLSLNDLSRRTDTSVPTLSRYENGWQRFELYTLQKLATALDCKLDITLKPIKKRKLVKNTKHVIGKIRRLFWDRKITAGILKEYPTWIVERILEFGNYDDLQLIMNFYGKDKFIKYVSECRFQTKKTANFWRLILEKEGVACTKRLYQREVWNS